MFYTCILYSEKFDRYYIGQTSDLSSRLARHNKGYVRSTKGYLPWEMVYFEEFSTRQESVNRETELKSWKSKKKLKELVDASRS